MQVRIKWAGDKMFIGEAGSGHAVIMDGAPEHGGRNMGVRPMEMLLLGLGGCTSFDVTSILKKARQKVRDCSVEISAERAETEPKVFTHIHVHFKVSGKNIDPKHVARAIELSAEKYCSASIMLGKCADITHDYEVIEDDDD